MNLLTFYLSVFQISFIYMSEITFWHILLLEVVYFNIFISLSWCISTSTLAVFDLVPFFYSFIGTRMKTVLCWKPVFVTMWPSWWISTLRGTNGLTTTECFWVCAFVLWGVLVVIWLQGLCLSLTQLLFCMQEEDRAQQKVLLRPAGQGACSLHGQS